MNVSTPLTFDGFTVAAVPSSGIPTDLNNDDLGLSTSAALSALPRFCIFQRPFLASFQYNPA